MSGRSISVLRSDHDGPATPEGDAPGMPDDVDTARC